MQVVHRVHVRHVEDVGADVGQVDALGGGLHQHVDGLAQQLPGPRQDQRPDQQRGDRVRAVPPGQRDDGGGDQHGDRAERVVDHFQPRGPGIEVAARDPGQQHDRDRVAGQPDHAEDDHRAGGHRRRLDQPPDRLDQDEPADRQQHRGLRRGGQHLGAPVPPGPVLGGRAAGQHRGHQGQRQPGDVGEHVPGVGQQGQRAGDERADHLDARIVAGDAQHDRQRPAVPGAGRAVIVAAVRLAATHATAARGTGPEAGHGATVAPVAASTPSAARSRSISSGQVSA